jgi:hypothetical protein
MAFRKKPDRRLIKSKAMTIDGINFKSRLEGYMYSLLKENNIKVHYFELFGNFKIIKKTYSLMKESNLIRSPMLGRLYHGSK